jgi:hypothetical protein
MHQMYRTDYHYFVESVGRIGSGSTAHCLKPEYSVLTLGSGMGKKLGSGFKGEPEFG